MRAPPSATIKCLFQQLFAQNRPRTSLGNWETSLSAVMIEEIGEILLCGWSISKKKVLAPTLRQNLDNSRH